MKKHKGPKLDHSSIQSRLGLCAAALAGTAAAVPSADASIITFNTPIVIPNNFAGVYIDLATGVNAVAPPAGWDINPFANAPNLAFYWNPSPANSFGGVAAGTTYLNLPPGTVVSGASTFSITIGGTTGSPFLTTGTEILGFRFFNEATSAINFGYMFISTTAAAGFPATVLSWSFDNTGAPITVVPEPGTAALFSIGALAFGALGLRQWRRQRAA
ncbi:MAG: PEP-CTERM sorting domain-containing protein [Verrucomicrobiota bacterium]